MERILVTGEKCKVITEIHREIERIKKAMEEKKILSFAVEPELFPLFEPIRCWCSRCEGKVLSRDELRVERWKGGIELYYSSGDYEVRQGKWIKGKQEMKVVSENGKIRIEVHHYWNDVWINIELIVRGWEIEVEKWEKEKEDAIRLTQWNFSSLYEILEVLRETLNNIRI